MHPELLAISASQGGVFTTAQALAAGYTSVELGRLHGRSLHRLRRGVYADRDDYLGRSSEERHLLALNGLAVMLRSPYVVSHVSAAVAHGLLLHDPDLSLLHVTRDARSGGRREAGVEHHLGQVPADQLVTICDRLPATSIARTAVDYARDVDFRRAVVALDSALRRGVTRAELLAIHVACDQWKGARTAGRGIAFADGRSESVGESLARVVFAEHGLPEPDLQRVLSTSRGPARVDFCFLEQRTVVEFDGLVKYAVPEGASPAQASAVLVREKLREDAIRDLGFEVVRMIWAELTAPAAVVSRIRAAFDRSRTRVAS